MRRSSSTIAFFACLVACSTDGVNPGPTTNRPAAPPTVDGDSTPQKETTLAITVTPANLFIARGASAPLTVTIDRGHWYGGVTLSLKAPSAEFSATEVTTGEGSASLDVHATTTASTTPTSVTIEATGGGLTTQTTVSVQKGASGAVDPTFGNGGVVIDHDIFPAQEALAVQPDGKVLVGSSDGPNVVRYDTNGTRDTTFGAGGVAKVPSTSNYDTSGGIISLQSDGKIVLPLTLAFNYPGPQLGQTAFSVVRLRADGTLDFGFGSGGFVSVYPGGYNRGRLEHVAIQPDGKLLAVGELWNDPPTDRQAVVMRFMNNGGVDYTFGSFAMPLIQHTWNGTGGSATASRVFPLAGGAAFVMGSRREGGTDVGTIAKLTSSGSLDTSFGNGGVYVYETPVTCLQASCFSFRTGFASSAGITFAADALIGRVSPNGSIDTTFGDVGFFRRAHTGDDSVAGPISIANDASARLLVAERNETKKALALSAFVGTTPDTTFGSSGMTSAPIGSFVDPEAIAIAPDGRIVVMATHEPSGDLVLARFFP